MKRKIWILVFVISACGSSNSESTDILKEGISKIPVGAVTYDYPNKPGLQKVILKSDGDIIAEGDALDGLLHGSYITYDGQGRIQSLTTYLNGIPQGIKLIFDNAGYVGTKECYYDGKLEGEIVNYKRRSIVERKSYKEDILYGRQQKFYIDGTLMEESNYVNGKIDGIARWYDQEGNVTIEYEYEMGNLVEK